MKIKIAIAGLITSCMLLIILLADEKNKSNYKDYEIISLKMDNKLKDSLYLYCNGELAKINNDPIYQYCIKNDLTDSE